MFNTILVPTDGSSLSDKAIQAAVEFAKMTGGKIVSISVAEPYPYMSLAEGTVAPDLDLFEKRMEKNAEMNVQKVADAAAAANVPCETYTAASFSPYQAIIDAAMEHHCDVIFMASHGRKGLNKLFVGSETQKVLAHSTIPVMVFR
jgi:nucleotide-binding universal stress UspA family protein